jgi:hypothetical protein
VALSSFENDETRGALAHSRDAGVYSYVQYGCGTCAPAEWLNFDASARIRLERIPGVRLLIAQIIGLSFPFNVRYGDIVEGLPIPDGSAAGVYASHVLEHLALEDCRIALRNTFRMLKSGGTFRLLVPDLVGLVRFYLVRVERGDPESCHWLMRATELGSERREGVLKSLITSFRTSKHLWMWDANSLSAELERVGFVGIRQWQFGDSPDRLFSLVEEKARFDGSCALEALKP